MAFEPKQPQKKLKYEELRIYTDEELRNYTEEELKNFKIKHPIPDLDELEKGPWPSFVADAKREALHRKKLADDRVMIPKDIVEDLLGQLQLSFDDGETHWKHGGIVGVFGYGGGVIGRYSDVPEKFPAVAHFHTIRVNQPASKFYKTDFYKSPLRSLGIPGERYFQPARIDGRHCFPGNYHRSAGTHFLRSDPRT